MNNILIIKGNMNEFERYFSNRMMGNQIFVMDWFDFFLRQDSLLKRLYFAYKKIKKLKKQGVFNEYSKIVIFDKYEIFIPLLLHLSHKKVKLFMWNTLGKKQGIIVFFINVLFKNVYTFDCGDAEKYHINYKSQFYFYQDRVNDRECKNKLTAFFVGKDKGRARLLESLRNELKKRDIKCDFFVVPDESTSDVNSLDFYVPSYMSYKEVLYRSKECAFIVDLVKEGQNGITIRMLEALFLGKKVITNNKKIKNEPFYNSEYIFILGLDPYERIEHMLKNENVNYSQEIVQGYAFEEWIKEF